MHINYILIYITTIPNCLCLFIDYKWKTKNDITSKLISQFTNHSVIFHYENSTSNRIDSIVAKANITNYILMRNYDVLRKQTIVNKKLKFIVKRPAGYKFLHVVLLENYVRFNVYTSACKLSIQPLDIILVFTNLNSNKREDHSNIYIENVNRSGAFFIANMQKYVLYSICFYCGENWGKWKLIADVSNTSDESYININNAIGKIYHNQFKDFNKHVFNVGYVVYKPFFWCTVTPMEDKMWFEFYGSEGALLHTLHKKLNMEFYLEEIHVSVNTWEYAINVIKDNTLDWAIGGISAAIKRFKVVDFTNYIHTEPYVVLYSIQDDPWMSWRKLITPFNMSIWLMLIFTNFTIACLFKIAIKFGRPRSRFHLGDFIQGGLRFLVEQPLPIIHPALRLRFTTFFLMLLWLTVALIMTNAYKSKLTSLLVNSDGEQFMGADQLVQRNYNFYVNKLDSSVLRDYLKSSEDSIFLEILKRAKNDRDFCTAVLLTLNNKIAVIDEATNINYLLQEYCDQLIPLYQQETLRILRKDLFLSYHGWPMSINAPYRHALNTIISQLHSAGIINKWSRDYSSIARLVPKSYQKSTKPLQSTKHKFTLTSLIGPVFIWLTGMIFATVTFMIEMIRGPK